MEMWIAAGRAVLNVALVGLVLGAGVPAIFAMGMRALGLRRAVSPDGHEFAESASLLGRVLSIVCFGAAIAAVLFGIVVIIWGKQIFS